MPGSRPAYLIRVRPVFWWLGDGYLGVHDNETLAEIEDGCIRKVIASQATAGLSAATDGDFRRQPDLAVTDHASGSQQGGTDREW